MSGVSLIATLQTQCVFTIVKESKVYFFKFSLCTLHTPFAFAATLQGLSYLFARQHHILVAVGDKDTPACTYLHINQDFLHSIS